jgi:hypothetical protein
LDAGGEHSPIPDKVNCSAMQRIAENACSRIVPLGISGGMSTKHVRTTGDLMRFGCALKVECTHCQSSRTLSASSAVKGLGFVDLRGVSRRFRCQRCGMKQARVKVLPPV